MGTYCKIMIKGCCCDLQMLSLIFILRLNLVFNVSKLWRNHCMVCTVVDLWGVKSNMLQRITCSLSFLYKIIWNSFHKY